MANAMQNYPKSTVPLLGALPVFILGSVLLEDAWRIVAIVVLLLLVAALNASASAQVKKQRDAGT
jgi:hypothetical protein